MKKVVFFALTLLASTVYAQYIQNVGMIDGATGNLVYTDVNRPPPGADPYSWSGFGSTTSNGGGYSGGYQPAWNGSTGTFMFGYNQGTIHYSTPVNFALSQAGTNIQVNGLRYSWEYLNQDYSRGTLSANINLTNSSGQVVQNYNYNMPRTTSGWTLYSGTENFNTQYQASSLGNLNVSFTGKDDRWWAGYYGPQVRNIDVGLLYSVAPPPVQTDFTRWVPLTNENGEFTLTTAGVVRYGAQGTYVYANFQPGTYSCTNSAWGIDPLGGVGKACDFGTNTPAPTTTPTSTALPKTVTATTDYSTTVPLLDPATTTAPITPTATSTTTTTSGTPSTVADSTPTVTTIGTVTASPTIVSAPAPTTTASTTTASSSSSTSSSSSASTTQSSTKESSGSSGGGNISLALSVISKNNERDAAGSAVAQSAVAQAQQAAAQAQQDASNIAQSAVSNSLTANAVTVGGQQSNGGGIKATQSSNSTNFSLQSGVTSLATVMSGPQTQTQTFVQQQSSGTGISVATYQPVIANTNTQQASNTNTVLALIQPQPTSIFTPVASVQTEQQTQPQQSTQLNSAPAQTNESYQLLSPNFLTDKSNPITDIVEGKQIVSQNSASVMTGPVVNKNTGDNEIAGGVKIDKMATAPTGYGDYLNFTMRDVAFYAPKEVYRNQRNVDNARALRQMTNDSKHKEMVEMQYAK